MIVEATCTKKGAWSTAAGRRVRMREDLSGKEQTEESLMRESDRWMQTDKHKRQGATATVGERINLTSGCSRWWRSPNELKLSIRVRYPSSRRNQQFHDRYNEDPLSIVKWYVNKEVTKQMRLRSYCPCQPQRHIRSWD